MGYPTTVLHTNSSNKLKDIALVGVHTLFNRQRNKTDDVDMSIRRPQYIRPGFTLIELLIVVVILGILAAVVIPQFSNAAAESELAQLQQDLRTVRTAIEVYKAEHDGRAPNIKDDGGDDNNEDHFIERLTGKTDRDGKINASGQYGPYLRRFPSNPFGAKDDKMNELKIGNNTPPDGDEGWYFNKDTGQFTANSAGHTSY